jgi:DNA-binding transcriptional ArsR family regulator
MDLTRNSPRLKPSLWRTCRVLANRERIRMLQIVAGTPSGLSVSSIAATAEVLPSRASVHLRLLNSRGLLSAKRSGRWVLYRLEPDSSIPESKDLINGLKQAFQNNPEPVEQIYRMTTAFTHPRRIAMVKLLDAKGPLLLDRLAVVTGYSSDALRRHLAKLEDRGVVYRAGPNWKLVKIREEPGRTLLEIARTS